MIIDSIQNGIVIDHITAGKAMELYNILGLDKLDCTVAILKNVTSGKLGRKDIIKIDREMDLDWDLIGYVDPTITVNIGSCITQSWVAWGLAYTKVESKDYLKLSIPMTYICGILLYVLTFVTMSGLGAEWFV
mgnify:CR=1 FL=1